MTTHTIRENIRVNPMDSEPPVEPPDGFAWPIWIWFIVGLAFWIGLLWWLGLIGPAEVRP